MNRVKPVKRSMWSNWHKTRAKQKHVCFDKDLSFPTVVRGSRYVWHYHKKRSWLEKRRFNLYNPDAVCMLFNSTNSKRDQYKAPRIF